LISILQIYIYLPVLVDYIAIIATAITNSMCFERGIYFTHYPTICTSFFARWTDSRLPTSTYITISTNWHLSTEQWQPFIKPGRQHTKILLSNVCIHV